MKGFVRWGGFPIVGKCSESTAVFLGALLLSFASFAADGDPVDVETAYGPVRGVEQSGVNVFKGIPFAKPPVGELRWTAPVVPEVWTNVVVCTNFSAGCPQIYMEYVSPDETDEDCLYLNVWSKKGATNLPVMVWLYGGGFYAGGSSLPSYDGTFLALKDVVFVSFNYRLGGLGFLMTDELYTREGAGVGNAGLLDQILALEWVRDNIAAFGGDPDNVTLFGHSAGAASVSHMLVAPQAKGLFHKAICQSGSVPSNPFECDNGSWTNAMAKGQALMDTLGVSSLDELRMVPASNVVEAAEVLLNTYWLHYGPMMDGEVVRSDFRTLFEGDDYLVSEFPLLTGVTGNDGLGAGLPVSNVATYAAWVEDCFKSNAATVFAAYPASTDEEAVAMQAYVGTLAVFAEPHRLLARALRDAGQPVYFYHWDYLQPTEECALYGAYHSVELPYVFNNMLIDTNFTARDYTLADQISDYWVNFARTGDPNGTGLDAWPLFGSNETALVVDTNAGYSTVSDWNAAELDFFTSVYPSSEYDGPSYFSNAVVRTQRSYTTEAVTNYLALPYAVLREVPSVPADTNDPSWKNFGTESEPDWRVRVSTYTWNYGTWQGHKRFDPIDMQYTSGGTTNYICSWVSFDDDLPDYLAATYGSEIATNVVEEKICMALGMPVSDGYVIVKMWVRPADLIRPAYNNSLTNTAAPPTDAHGRYVTVSNADDNVRSGARIQDYIGNLYTMGEQSFIDFMTNNFKTTYPWTAMGYTWNWDPALGVEDTNHIGVDEFIISGGARVYFEQTIPNDKFAAAVAGDPVYTITVDGSDYALVYSNSTVQISAPDAPEGQVFYCWTGDTQYVSDVHSATPLVTMPGTNMALTATYGLAYTGTIASARNVITNLMAEHSIPGCTIVLVESQRVVWAEGFGYANKETQTPVTTNTVMAIGSVSKMLTAIMALQMRDNGDLDLDASVTNKLTEFSMQPRFPDQVSGWTMRALLTHHAGLPGDIYNGSFVTGPYWPGFTAWLIDYFADDFPLYPPGLQASYCNSAFILMGEVIARHDGKDFTEASEDRLFTPLQMPYSSFLPDKAAVSDNLATGYNADGTPAPNITANMPATGGAFSRPLDMANVIKMMLANGEFGGMEFLTTDALTQFGTETPGPLDVDNFFRPGLGLDSVADPVLKYAGRTWLKNGSTGKFESLFEVLPDQQLGAFVNINCANSMTFSILRAVLTNAVLEKSGLAPTNHPPMPDPPETNWSFAELQAVEGYYATKAGVDRFIAETDGSLTCIPNAQSSMAEVTNYRPHVNGRFYIPGSPAQQLAFTNIAGYDVVLRYGSDGSVRDEAMYGGYVEALYGTRCSLPEISAAWSNRCGTFWMADNIMWDDSFVADGNPCGCMLSCENGILSLVSTGGNGILIPTNDTLAFIAGLSTRGDSAVRVETNAAGQERLWFGGYRCVRLEDIPSITNMAIEDLSLAMHTNALFMYGDMDAGLPVALVGSTNAEDVVFTIFSTDSLSVIACGTGTVEWICEEEPVIISLRSPGTKDVRIRQVYTGWVHDGMKKTLALYPRVPGFITAVQGPGFLPLVMTEGYACIHPPSTNESALLTGNEHFRLASISKFYTATAIMRLRERGLLHLTNTVAHLAPELMAPRGEEITIELLLAHRSGLPDGNNTPWIDDKLHQNRFIEFTPEETVWVASNMYPHLMFEPGTDYHYTDTGYNILARIIENVSGTNYQAFMRSELLDPLRLTNTFVPYNDEYDVPPPVMHAYATVDGVYDDWTRYSPSAELGCGSVIANIEDLMRFASTVLNSTNVLSAESRALMMERLSQTGSDSYAGRGAMFKEGFGWGHGGNMWGMNSYVAVDTNSGVTVAACNNGMEYDDAQKLFNAIFAMYSAMGQAKNEMGYESGEHFGWKPPVIVNSQPEYRQGVASAFTILSGNFVTNWTASNLPPGMTLDADTGVISGAPSATGAYEVVLVAQNVCGSSTNTLTYTVTTAYTNTIAHMTAWITNAMAAEGSVGCSIALVDGPDVVWAQGFGYADVEAGLPVTTDTVFHIGSCSKAFTGVAALHYADFGTLDIDQPLTNYLPDLSWKERYPEAEPVTVRHLLSMYSGLPGDLMRDSFTTAPIGPGYEVITNDLAHTYPVCPPDYFWNYANVNFVLMEGVIEALANTGGTARAFTHIVDDILFTPLGMEATSYLKDKPAISNYLAKPYRLNPGAPVEMPEEFVEIYGTGSMYSRPTDMAKFMAMLFGDGAPLLFPPTFDDMVTPQGTNTPFAPYFSFAPGLGWDFVKYPPIDYAGRICSKNGGTLAFTANMQLMIDRQLGVAIVVSSQGSSIPNAATIETLRYALLEKEGIPWPDNPESFAVATQAVEQAELDALAGVYAGSSEYDLAEAQSGSITYRRSVPSGGAVYSNLTLRTNGWFVADANPAFALGFTNQSGCDMVVAKYVQDGVVMQMPMAVRYEPIPLNEAWSNRIGRTWYMVNETPVSYFPQLGVPPEISLACSNGVLFSAGNGFVANRALVPSNDSVAFVHGPLNRGDSCIQIIENDGEEYVLAAGWLYAPAPEALPVQSNLTGVIARAGEARWVEIAPVGPTQPVGGVSNVAYELTLSDVPSNFLLRVYQADGVSPVGSRRGPGALAVPGGAAPLLLTIQPDVDGVQTGAYDVAFSLPLTVREITMRDGRFGLVWQGPSNVAVNVESALDLAFTNAFAPVVTNLPAPDVLNTYTNPPSIEPMRFFRIRETEE